ncbi:hypothetical protein GUI12_01810 [Anaplasmataceae bacterium AB001_6]|nr:hypothetical protein GUI12_01810 [Anaplasmataceae bacterium AB001_6]
MGNTISMSSLLLIVFIDSFGNGIAFSLFPIMIFSDLIKILLFMRGMDPSFIDRSMMRIHNLCMFIFSPIIGNISDIYGKKIIYSSI